MKVVILGPAHPYRGGIASFNEKVAEELIEMGHEVVLYTFTLQYPSILFPGKTQYALEKKANKLKILRTLNSINPFSWIKTGMMIKKEQADVIICKYWLPFMSPSLSTSLFFAKKNKKSKVISILDNITPHEKRFGDDFFNKMFINQVDAFISMSQTVEDDLKTFDNKKPKLLSPHPIYDNFGEKTSRDFAIDKLKLDSSKKYILFFGFIRAYKGLDILLNAFAKSKIYNNDVRLIIAGEYYENEQKYQEIIKEKGISDYIIHYKDFIKESEVKLFFSLADVVIQPYKTATQSGVTQIGYHFEVPMIVTDVGGLAEIIPDGKVGYVVPPNEDELAKKIITFFTSTNIEEFKKNLIEEKKKYSWATMIDNVLKLNKSLNE